MQARTNFVSLARQRLTHGCQDINGATCAHYAIELRRFQALKGGKNLVRSQLRSDPSQILDAALEAMSRRRSWVACASDLEKL